MKKTFLPSLMLALTATFVASCTEIPTISIGPTSDMQISDALMPNNFLNYRVKINYLATSNKSARVTSAAITTNDLLFIVYQDELTFNDYARYYFDKTGNDEYDVFFYDKEAANPNRLGYNFYEGFKRSNPNPAVLPLEEINHYFGVYPYAMLRESMFNYRDSKTEFGIYDLKTEEFSSILRDFFQLDETLYQIDSFALEIRQKKIYTFRYQINEIVDPQLPYLSNKIDFIYDNIPLEAPAASLINNLRFEPVYLEVPVETSSEVTSSLPTTIESSPPVSEETSSSSSISVSESSSEIPSSSTTSSEPVKVLDHYRLNFTLIDDAKHFQGAKPEYPLASLELYQGRFDGFAEALPLVSNDDLTLRYFKLMTLLEPGTRYTIRLTISATTSAPANEYYYHSFIA